MKRILYYLKKYMPESLLAPVLKCLEACLELLVPLIMKQIIDEGIPSGDFEFIAGRGFMLLGLGLFGLLFSYIAQYFAAHAAFRLGTSLRNSLFEHVNSLSMAEMDQYGTSKLINRLNTDVTRVQDGVNLFLRLFLRSPFIVVGALALSFFVDPGLALLVLLITPIMGIVIYVLSAYSIPIISDSQGKLDALAEGTRSNLKGTRVIRAFQRMDAEKRKFADNAQSLKVLQVTAGRVTELMNPVTYVLLNVVMVVIISMGADKVNTGTVSVGTIIALLDYLAQIMVEALRIADLIVSLSKAIASSDRVEELFATKNSMADGTVTDANPTDEVVVFDHVSLNYQNSADMALNNVSFSIRKGMTVGIIGGTGEGKSSLVKLMPRLYDATEGAVYVDGVNVKDYALTALRKKFSFVSQHTTLFKGTIRDNMKMGKNDASDEEIIAALKTASCLSFLEDKENFLDYPVQKLGSNFSGGQKQRLSIARALVRNPEILILDDSFSALDGLTDLSIRRALAEKYADTTMFIVSQRVSAVMKADAIIVLSDGSLAGIGSHDLLWETCNEYRQICSSQQITKEGGAKC